MQSGELRSIVHFGGTARCVLIYSHSSETSPSPHSSPPAYFQVLLRRTDHDDDTNLHHWHYETERAPSGDGVRFM